MDRSRYGTCFISNISSAKKRFEDDLGQSGAKGGGEDVWCAAASARVAAVILRAHILMIDGPVAVPKA